MAEAEAKAFGIHPDERKRHVRLDKAKANLVPAMKAVWFRLVSVNIGNADAAYPEGDDMQAIERWDPPAVWADVTPEALNAILDGIEAGLEAGRRYSRHNAAKQRAAWKVVQQHCPDKTDIACQQIIHDWFAAGVLLEKSYTDAKSRSPENGLYVDAGKRPQY
jgi:hypothetical protein